jgi:hypothetical protein
VDIGCSVDRPSLPQWRHGFLSQIGATACAAETPPDDLYDYARAPVRPGRRRAKRDRTTLTVTDDWPEDVPVTEAEIAVFEAWFGELFDELFGDG